MVWKAAARCERARSLHLDVRGEEEKSFWAKNETFDCCLFEWQPTLITWLTTYLQKIFEYIKRDEYSLSFLRRHFLLARTRQLNLLPTIKVIKRATQRDFYFPSFAFITPMVLWRHYFFYSLLAIYSIQIKKQSFLSPCIVWTKLTPDFLICRHTGPHLNPSAAAYKQRGNLTAQFIFSRAARRNLFSSFLSERRGQFLFVHKELKLGPHLVCTKN